MTGIEIVLVIIGVLCICVSFFVSQKQKPEEEVSSPASVSADVWTDKDEEIVRKRIQQILSDEQDEMTAEAKEYLERLCNEKIMAVDEFSSQILEKMKDNHQEVVFMYNMLNDKQKDLKELFRKIEMRRVEEMKRNVSAAPTPQNEQVKKKAVAVPKAEGMQNVDTQSELLKKKVSNQALLQTQPQQSAQQPVQPQSLSQQPVQQQPLQQSLSQQLVRQQPLQQPSQQPASKMPQRYDTTQPANETEDINRRIQKMYKAGKSVLEISKDLNIGQGEVKLVLALYGGRK